MLLADRIVLEYDVVALRWTRSPCSTLSNAADVHLVVHLVRSPLLMRYDFRGCRPRSRYIPCT